MTIRLASAGDLSRLCRTAMRAFATDPLMRWLFPDDRDYFAGDGRVMRYMIRRWLAFGHTYTTADGVAVAAFVPPGRPEVDVPYESADGPVGAELMEKFAVLAPMLAEHTPAEPHWYLNLLATHPDWQRQGLGAAAIAPIGERCAAEGLPMYLETETPENVAYYSHLGFRVTGEFDVPLDGPHMWGMLRDP